MGQLFLGLILLLFWLVGISMIVQSYGSLRSGVIRRKWSSVEAVVTDHKIYTHTTGGQVSRTAYGYSVMYTYNVEDQTYQGSGFDHGNFVQWELAEQASIVDYPIGKVVEIFAHPDNPESSSSITSSEQVTYGLVMLCFSIGWTSLSTGMIALVVNLNRADAIGSVAMPLLQIGILIILSIFWCSMLTIILSTLTHCFKEIKHRRLPRPGVDLLIVLFLFSLLSTHLVHWLVYLAGVILDWSSTR